MDIADRFEAVKDEYIEFDRIENKRSKRPDLHAFLLLDELFPNNGIDMVCGAMHDEIWLEPDGGKLDGLTDEQILELTRCGVRYDSDTNGLAIFV
jgi:diadenosine tetraphosphatase ApaH/serine/threonine PP2A family protein phosphatase